MPGYIIVLITSSNQQFGHDLGDGRFDFFFGVRSPAASAVSIFSLKFSGHFGEDDGSGTDWLSVSGFEFRALL